MCIKNHLIELKKKHEAVDANILLLQLCPGHDSLQIKALKKDKLRLKEQIARLENPARAMAPKSKKLPKAMKVQKSSKAASLPTPVPHLVSVSRIEPEAHKQKAA